MLCERLLAHIKNTHPHTTSNIILCERLLARHCMHLWYANSGDLRAHARTCKMHIYILNGHHHHPQIVSGFRGDGDAFVQHDGRLASLGVGSLAMQFALARNSQQASERVLAHAYTRRANVRRCIHKHSELVLAYAYTRRASARICIHKIQRAIARICPHTHTTSECSHMHTQTQRASARICMHSTGECSSLLPLP